MDQQPTKTVQITLPNESSLSAEVPADFEDDVMKLLFTSVLGALHGIKFLHDEELRSSFILRFTGEIVSLSENSVRTVQMANQLDTGSKVEDAAKIIEQFLASLGKKDQDKPK
jgi:hypothetical protein